MGLVRVLTSEAPIADKLPGDFETCHDAPTTLTETR